MIVSLASIPTDLIEMVESKTGEKIIVYNLDEDKDGAMRALSEAEIAITWSSPIRNGVFNNCRYFKLKWLFSLTVGVENLPFADFIDKGIIVTNTRGLLGPHVAEQTIGMMIAFSRRLKRCFENQLKRVWEQGLPVDELTGKTLCIVGAGGIGSEIARKTKAFDMKVIGLKRRSEALKYFDEVWGMEELGKALGLADYIVLTVPLTEETYHLIGQQEFKLMKRSSVLINMSRGDTVDEKALIAALYEGRIAGAGLDVFHEEPLPPESPLWGMDNVIITPHNAGNSPYLLGRAMKLFAENLILFRQGSPMKNIVNLESKY